MRVKLVVVVEPFRQGEHDGSGIGDGIHRDVIALEGAHEGFGHTVALRLWIGVVSGSRPISRAKRRVGPAMKQEPLSVSHSMVCGRRLIPPKRCSTQ